MIKKIVGAILLIAGVTGTILFIVNGMIFPHLAGPIILVIAGVILLVLKRKGNGHEQE